MMTVIGTKRLFILIILLGLNGLIGTMGYFYIIPEEKSSSSRLKSIQGEVTTVQSDISRMQIEFEQLGLQQKDFDALKDAGYFKLQSRNEAKALFQLIQAESSVVSATASVKPGIIEENEEAQKAKHKILASKIEIAITALDDTAVYRYILLAQKNFIGHLSLDQLEINRTGEVTPQILRSVSAGNSPELISAKLVMTWRTIIPETQVIVNQAEE